MAKHLLLVWEDTRGSGAESYHSLIFDLIHVDLFLSPRSEGTHITAYTDAEGRVEIRHAKFKSRSSGNIIAFDYDKKENRNNNIYIGTMILNFDSITKSNVVQVRWRDNNHRTNLDVEHSPGSLIVSASWKEFDHENSENNYREDFFMNIITNMRWSQSLYS